MRIHAIITFPLVLSSKISLVIISCRVRFPNGMNPAHTENGPYIDFIRIWKLF